MTERGSRQLKKSLGQLGLGVFRVPLGPEVRLGLLTRGMIMRRTWIKLFCDQWLRGSIRKEPVEVRAVFTDLLTMAGDSGFGDPNIAANGTVQLADDVGFTDEAIASILNVPLKTWGSRSRKLLL